MSEPPIEVVLHSALIEPFKKWLEQRGLMLMRFPDELQEEGRLEQFLVSPTDETMRRASER
jgi:hypothetical protein